MDAIKAKLESGFGTIRADVFANLFDAARGTNQTEQVLDLAVHAYTKSFNFNSADERFSGLLLPFLESLTQANLLALLKGIEENNQTYGRGRAKRDHAKLKVRCDAVLGSNFDYTAYPYFLASTLEVENNF